MSSIIIKKKILFKWIIMITLVFRGLNIFHKNAKAAEFILPLDSEIHGILTTENNSNTYKIQLTKAGRLFLNMTSYIDSQTYIQLYDDNNEVVFNDSTESSSKTPAKYNHWVDLEPGNYYIKIYNKIFSWEENVGTYTLNVTCTLANNNDIEPNNGTVEAQSIAFKQSITGFLSWNDNVDIYKITLPKAGRLNVDIN